MAEIITEKNYPIQALWLFKSIFTYLILGVFLISIPFILKIDITSGLLPIILLFIGIVGLNLIYAALLRGTFHYSIEDNYFVLNQGILSKQQRNIPYGVIQNVYVKQDFLDRIFGLAAFSFENAGKNTQSLGDQFFGQQANDYSYNLATGRYQRRYIELVGFAGNKVNIPGLTKDNAEILKGILLAKMKENPVNNQLGM